MTVLWFVLVLMTTTAPLEKADLQALCENHDGAEMASEVSTMEINGATVPVKVMACVIPAPESKPEIEPNA